MEAEIVNADQTVVVAIWSRTVIHIWRGTPTLAAVLSVRQASEHLLATPGRPVTCLAVVEKGSPPPDADVREALAAWSRDVVPHMATAAIVADGGGFRASLVRGVGVALSMMAPHKVPFRFSSSVEEALVHLAPSLSTAAGGVGGLRTVVASLRAMEINKI